MTRCTVTWETTIDDIDGDGVAGHECMRNDGHPEEDHWCDRHFACSPIFGDPAWLAAEGDAD